MIQINKILREPLAEIILREKWRLFVFYFCGLLGTQWFEYILSSIQTYYYLYKLLVKQTCLFSELLNWPLQFKLLSAYRKIGSKIQLTVQGIGKWKREKDH